MGLKLKKIKISTDTVTHAARVFTENPSKVTARAAARASRRLGRNLQRQAEEARRRAEAAAEAAKRKAEEEAAATAAELEKKAREAEEAAKAKAAAELEAAAKELKEKTEALIKNQVNNAFSNLDQNIGALSEQGKQLVSKLEELRDLTDLNKLKAEVLNRAEQLGEEYLKEKLAPIENQLSIVAIPDLELNLDKSTLLVQLNIYFMLPDDRDKSTFEFAIASINSEVSQSITQITAPSVSAKFVFNPERISGLIKNEIESQKDKLVQMFFEMFFSEYLTVFKKIQEAIPDLF
ncbi:hypothetical protein [Paenibacillus sp. B1-33]|uniref:hypothetical protein n=1 Tax=unclassified Paenibacillus TaxID=185978 RepID=UPI003D2D04B7